MKSTRSIAVFVLTIAALVSLAASIPARQATASVASAQPAVEPTSPCPDGYSNDIHVNTTPKPPQAGRPANDPCYAAYLAELKTNNDFYWKLLWENCEFVNYPLPGGGYGTCFSTDCLNFCNAGLDYLDRLAWANYISCCAMP